MKHICPYFTLKKILCIGLCSFAFQFPMDFYTFRFLQTFVIHRVFNSTIKKGGTEKSLRKQSLSSK